MNVKLNLDFKNWFKIKFGLNSKKVLLLLNIM